MATTETQQGKTALITGASSGIGKEMARIHAQRGGDLVLVARSQDKLEALKQELEGEYGISATVIVGDLTQLATVDAVYDQVKAAGIEVDYLVNNAGFGGHGLFHERDWEADLAMINLNVIALTALTRKFLPGFVARNSGRVLNVSSTASLMPGPLQAVYFATKAFVTFLSNAIAEELRETDVTVTALLPGATATGFAATSGMDKTNLFSKTATAESVAFDGYEGMLKGKLDVISGLTFGQKVMMKTIPFAPKKTLLKQVRQMQEVA